ncbi:MAG TPA: bifunctional oligoribonuclease/PAP phosphatase NrnA [Bdellovibrionota bacterium]|nr:bifunctional oligoribonuclease/PAP phosphatase NrnA [Bdellovibrionota bacterium]
MNNIEEIDEAVAVIKKSDSFLLTCHVSPDADALGSVLAMGLALKKLGKTVDWYNQDNVPASLEFLPGTREVHQELNLKKNYDVVMTGDSGELSRLGKKFEEYKNYKCLINVDHHITNTRFGDINVIEETASSTGTVMMKIIDKLQVDVTADIATCIFATLVADTGSFQYTNTTKEAFDLAGKLVGKGVDPGTVSQNLYFSFPAEKLLLLKRVLNTLEFSPDHLYSSITLRLDDLKELNVDRDVAEDFIDLPRSVKSVKVAAFFKEVAPEKFKISLRSKYGVDVSRVCGYFGGGGHYAASGCLIEGALEDVKKRVYEQSQKAIQSASVSKVSKY